MTDPDTQTDQHEKLLGECQEWIDNHTLKLAEPQIAWVDVETTGLDYDGDLLLELGFIVTDSSGAVVTNGVFQSIIFAPEGIDWDGKVDPFVKNMHSKSRLATEIEFALPELESIGVVEQKAIRFLKDIFGEDMADLGLPLAGSSVGFDKRWIEGRMPELASLFGYRVLDVSSLRIAANLVDPDVAAQSKRPALGAHRVVPDIIDTIEEFLVLTGQSDDGALSIIRG